MPYREKLTHPADCALPWVWSASFPTIFLPPMGPILFPRFSINLAVEIGGASYSAGNGKAHTHCPYTSTGPRAATCGVLRSKNYLGHARVILSAEGACGETSVIDRVLSFQSTGVEGAEFDTPETDRFSGYSDAALSQ